ncbi:MAG: DUF1553 domain-containing protein [Planctomycetota bacterium]
MSVLGVLVTTLLANGPNTSAITAVESWPASIELGNRFESAQLVLMGRLPDGALVDVTRDAQLAPSDLVQVTERGRIRPLRDGAGTLSAKVGEHEVAIPVRVDGVSSDYAPSFVNDVLPLLTRLGCNAGTCHGSAKGKNGFKLSLRGYDAAYDHEALTDDLAGRRFNRAMPEQSLFLLKPTASVPHEGGKRLDLGSKEYELLRQWVEHGAKLDLDCPRVVSIDIVPKEPVIPLPAMSQQMAVLATYADGRVRDVTANAALEVNDTEVATVDAGGLVSAVRRGDCAVLARFSGRYAATRVLVMGDRREFVWQETPERSFIDALVDAKLRTTKTLPSMLCSDADFLRRITLDLTGLLPSARDVRTFLADTRPSQQKRDEVIERLIGGTEFVAHWTNKWADLLQVNSKFLGVEGAARLRDWIARAVASNLPYDQFVAQILDASGSTFDNPPAAYYKVLRQPDVCMENTTQLFLGLRFSCNKCHDHPFERWTQEQHWQLAAFFAQVGRENVPGSPLMPQALDNRPDDEPKAVEERMFDRDAGEVKHPNRGTVVAPAFPYDHAGMVPADGPRRARLTAWLASADNPYFARSYANRLWSYFLGVGLIEPVDDIRASNPPTNPDLLDALARELVHSGFDTRHMMRLICQSQTYQRALATNRWNEDDQLHYAHAYARRLPAETLFDALHQATGHKPRVSGARAGTRADEMLDPSVKPSDGFLELFGRPPRESACECERSSGVSLGQALSLVNGPTLAEAIEDRGNAISDLAADEQDATRIIDELYLRFLSRPPSADERERARGAFAVNNAANVAALPPADLADYQARRASFVASVPKVEWHLLDGLTATSAAGATLAPQGDGSVLASGTRPERDTYTVLAWTKLEKITGVRLEVLPDASLPQHGPGRSDSGNFVLGELKLTAIGARGPLGGKQVALANASADFSQDQFAVGGAIDGKPETGWATYPRPNMVHRAVFETSEDIGGEGGTLLVFTFDQPFGGAHTIGRFRIAVSTSARPVRFVDLADDVVAALCLPAASLTGEQEQLVHGAFLGTAPDLVERMRLAAAQDLAWALATSPAFLFNR